MTTSTQPTRRILQSPLAALHSRHGSTPFFGCPTCIVEAVRKVAAAEGRVAAPAGI